MFLIVDLPRVCKRQLESKTEPYKHFKSNAPGAPKNKTCPLYDDTQARNFDEIENALKAAAAEVAQKNPDLTEDDLKKLAADKPKTATAGDPYHGQNVIAGYQAQNYALLGIGALQQQLQGMMAGYQAPVLNAAQIAAAHAANAARQAANAQAQAAHARRMEEQRAAAARAVAQRRAERNAAAAKKAQKAREEEARRNAQRLNMQRARAARLQEQRSPGTGTSKGGRTHGRVAG